MPRNYPEGGWGWMIVLASCLSEFICFGNLKALGVLIVPVKEDLDKDLWVVGSIVSFFYGVQFVTAPVVAVVARIIGSRSVSIFGGILVGLGFVLAALTDNIYLFATAIAVISGLGTACSFWTTHGELAFYFHEKFALAIFVSMAGAPLGMMLYGPAIQVIIDTYGWRGAMLVMGGVSFHLVVGGMLLRRPAQTNEDISAYEQLPAEDVDGNTENIKRARHNKTECCGSFVSALGLDLFRSADFLIVVTIRMLYSIGYGGLVVYMVPNGLALGLSTREASFLTTAWGVGMLAGLSVASLLLQMEVLSVYSTSAIGAIVTAIFVSLVPFITSFVGQMMLWFMIGAGLDCVIQNVYVLSKCLPFADDKFVSILGWQSLLAGVACSIADTITGWLHDATESFLATFLVYSITMAAIALCVLIHVLRDSSKAV